MKKSLLSLFMLAVLFHCNDNADCAEISSDQHVKNFYIWYITEVTQSKDPLSDCIIEQYVDRCVVKSIRILYLRLYFDVDYFTKSQDIWKEWIDKLVVHGEVKINETTSIIPVSFVFTETKRHQLVVFIQYTNDGPRIIKVTGTRSVAE